uniref:TIMELESS-interacting protein n=1 Tax=Anthurium amnicola TaxID=1678845 RepID=A0A1D1ZHD2_9ARAE
MQRGDGGGGVAPTGCFKCGRPGHWSRDCPSSSSSAAANPNPGSSSFSKLPRGSKRPLPEKDKAADAGSSNPAANDKKAGRTRPKLTPDLLLSDDGIGYVLSHFPRSFKCHGRGHEVDDLGRLIDLYAEWHSRLIPYYSFTQFIHKVEQVGATRRVRRCVDELRQKIANGGDPTKLHEPPTALVSDHDTEVEALETGVPAPGEVDPPLEKHNADDIPEEIINEIYQKATEEPSQSLHLEPCQPSQSMANFEANPEHRFTKNQVLDSSATETSKIQITEEQRARMQANRLKALERAGERSRSLQVA